MSSAAAIDGSDHAPTASAASAKVFISYSRKDIEFADRIEKALRSRGFQTMIDRAEIYALEDWWARIQSLISQADTILFVISPNAVASDVCQQEVNFAASLSKRLAPVVYRPVEDGFVPPALAKLNFIFFTSDESFDSSLLLLSEALETDIGWVRKHTEFGVLARRWSQAGRPGPRGLLLRSPTLEEAERWIASRPATAPIPSEETRAFIIESRVAATRRRTLLSGLMATASVVAITLASLALWQRSVAVAERNEAKINESRAIAARAKQASDAGDQPTAMLLALEALPPPGFGGDRPILPEAAAVLRQAWSQNREVTLAGHTAAVSDIALSPNSEWAVTTSADSTSRLWDLSGKRPVSKILDQNPSNYFISIDSVFLLPDGKRVVTVMDDGIVTLWDLAQTGKPLHRFGIKMHNIIKCLLASDGRKLALLPINGPIVIWDLTDSALPPALLGSSMVTGGKQIDIDDSKAWLDAAFHKDGRHLATSSLMGTVRVWDISSPQSEPILLDTSRNDTPLSVTWSADGVKLAATMMDGTTRVGEPFSSKPTGTITLAVGHPNAADAVGETAVNASAFSPDATLLATGAKDGAVRLWRVAESESAPILLGKHGASVNSVQFNGNGRFVLTASDDRTVRIWDIRSPGEAVLTFRGHNGAVTRAGFNHDHTAVISISQDGTARLWRLSVGPKSSATLDLRGDVVLGATDNSANKGSEAASIEQPERLERGFKNRKITTVLYGPDNKFMITISSGYRLRLWENTSTGPKLRYITPETEAVAAARFKPDGSQFATIGLGGQATFHPLTRPANAKIFKVPGDLYSTFLVRAINRTATRAIMATVSGAVWYWQLDKDPPVASHLGDLSATPSAVSISDDGNHAIAASNSFTVQFYDLSGPKTRMKAMSGLPGWVTSVEYSRDGRHFATNMSGGSVFSGDSGDDEPIITNLESGGAGSCNADISPDGKKVAACYADNTVHLWDISAAKPAMVKLSGAKAPVQYAAFSRDGKLLVTGSHDGSAEVWTALDHPPLGFYLNGHERAVISGDVKSDDSEMATGSEDGTARIWNLNPNALALAAEILPTLSRCLSPAQRVEFGLSIPAGTKITEIFVPPDQSGHCPL